MSSPTKLLTKAGVLPAIVLLLSILSLFTRPVNFSTPAVFVSVAGILAVALYVFDFYRGAFFFSLWVLVQLLVIKKGYQPGREITDLTQGIKLPLYLPFTYNGEGYQVGLNLVAVFLLGLIFASRPKELVGHTLSFSSYRGGNNLGIEFPLKGRVEKQVNLSGEKNWLLVKLDKQFNYTGGCTSYALVSRNDKQAVVKHRTNQLVFFKPVADVSAIGEGANDKKLFIDEAWALCK